MKIDLKKERFESIEDAFRDLQSNRSNTAGPIRKIKSNLKETFPDKKFDIVITDNKTKTDFFIMSIFPETSTLDAVVDAVIDGKNDEAIRKIWNGSSSWTVEIDSKILYGNIVDTNPKQLTALLLHELGHVVYSNSIPQRISKVMRLEYARANMKVKALVSNKLFRQILRLPIMTSCIFDNYKTSANIKKELKADVFVIKMGYGEHLEEVLNKLILLSSSKKETEIDLSSGDVYAKMKSTTLFSLSTIEQFKDRENVVAKKNLQKMLLSSPSTFVQKTVSEITDKVISGNTKDINVSESTRASRVSYLADRAYDEYVTEFFSFKRTLKRIDPTDMDYIELQKNNVKTNDDKMMLISYIHSKLDTIMYYISILDSNATQYTVPHTKKSLIDMKTRLEKIKDDVMTFKIPEPNYSLVINYPDGYKG